MEYFIIALLIWYGFGLLMLQLSSIYHYRKLDFEPSHWFTPFVGIFVVVLFTNHNLKPKP